MTQTEKLLNDEGRMGGKDEGNQMKNVQINE